MNKRWWISIASALVCFFVIGCSSDRSHVRIKSIGWKEIVSKPVPVMGEEKKAFGEDPCVSLLFKDWGGTSHKAYAVGKKAVSMSSDWKIGDEVCISSIEVDGKKYYYVAVCEEREKKHR
jgi:hypothetical protein